MTDGESQRIPRTLPALDDLNRFFWTAGSDGVLRIQRCVDCSALIHPPQPICRYCRSERLAPTDVSGLGTIIGITENHQRWDPAFPPPFVVVSVALDEDARVRLVTSLIDASAEDAIVGRRVRVTFEHVEDVWLPCFSPTANEPTFGPLPEDPISPSEHRRAIRPMLVTAKFEDQVAITGIGMSPVGRGLMVAPISLAVAAAKAAISDAGLEFADIDGLSSYPGQGDMFPGFSEGGVMTVADALGIAPTWYNSGSETFGPGGSVIAAMLAVATGMARHVLCFRTVWQATYAAQLRASDPDGPSPYAVRDHASRVEGSRAYQAPYGVGSVAMNLAMVASNHFHRYGTTREALGWIAINQRTNAALNPDAIYREPLTMDDYLSARTIATPFGLYDCDVPMDASIAVIVSAKDAAADLAKPPVYVEAVGTQITERFNAAQSTMSHEPQTLGPSAHLWSRTSLRPADVQVAELYDGFSFNCLSWLEGLGFCGIGEAGDFLAGGQNIARVGGAVALNTHGGQLSAGRTHGMGHIYEAVVQLRGDAGERQVAGCNVAAVSTGGLAPAGAMLLRRA